MSIREREEQVLATLVRLFVRRREPISSRMLEESGELDIRSASIRSVLGALEKKGYLVQPHSSSGRIPTDEGYRAYVDGYLDPEGLSPTEERAVQEALRAAGDDIESLLRATAGVLGQFSHNIAILAGPRQASPHITSIELYARDSQHVLVVVTLDKGSVRSELVKLDNVVRPQLLHTANSFLCERLIGRTLDEMRRDLERFLDPADGDGEGLGAALAESADSLFARADSLQLSFDGISEALEQPEFEDAERVKSLLQLVARHDEFERALEAFVTPAKGKISLAIGSENQLPTLHPFSVMATRFELEDDRYGYLAVLGPRRMRYARLNALIRLISSYLDSIRA